MNIIYVAGYGRSGSTLLDRSLGHRTNVTSLGELAIGPSVVRIADHLCSCGHAPSECELWGSVTLPKDPPGEGVPMLMRSLFDNTIAEHARAWAPTFRDLDGSPKCAATVVDSSKSTYARVARPRLLAKAGHTVFPVLIWRDPVDVLESRAAARATRATVAVPWAAALEGVVSWVLANVFGLLLCQLRGGVVVSFEDLIRDRAASIERIAIKADTRHGIELGPPGTADGHLIAGNRMRIDPGGIGAERPSRPQLSGAQRLVVQVISAGLKSILRKVS